jgi:hydroxymethylglutaryl-CoA reductase
MSKKVSGFSKLNKTQKIDWLLEHYFHGDVAFKEILLSYWNSDSKLQQLHDEFIENTISNFYLPFGVAPNFLINDTLFTIPMVIEESSVVAAASNAAKFWLDKGGFKAEVLSTIKNGQVHFNYFGDTQKLTAFFEFVKPKLFSAVDDLAKNMKKRGGGVLDIVLIDKTETLKGYFHLHCTFETADAMGANFINSCLEQFAKTFKEEALKFELFSSSEKEIEVVMSILSNYVPECLVKAEVSCKTEALTTPEFDGNYFAEKFVRAIQIANAEPRRAVTHNKGIMNGLDAVVLATGNDFRAVEAGVHAYASRNGSYRSLTHAEINGDTFHFWIEIPLAIGTVGGLTSLHPLVKVALAILQKPTAKELMQIMAVTGLAQNFAAVKSLITTGIQEGHMKMHLMNILNQLNATDDEKQKAITHFQNTLISHSAAISYINSLRN